MKNTKYFYDPLNFADVSEFNVNCDICGKLDICFTSTSFYGVNKLKYVCDDCLIQGKLKKYNMSGNEPSEVDIKMLTGSKDEIEFKCNQLIYCTPKIPSWQDIWWPVADGDFCIFKKIASKNDFNNKFDLYNKIRDEDKYDHTVDDFWEMLADGPITNLKNGNYSPSFYIFTSITKIIVLWDCN